VSKTSDREVNEVSDKTASLSELIVKVLVGRPTFSEWKLNRNEYQSSGLQRYEWLPIVTDTDLISRAIVMDKLATCRGVHQRKTDHSSV